MSITLYYIDMLDYLRDDDTTMHCIKCQNTFLIAQEDDEFYNKLSIPSPKMCPDCRRQRRFVFRNERALYSRTCDLCKKATVSFYSSLYPGPVYCQPCWWSDNWDPFSYGRPYDPSRPFFDQLKELFRTVPLPSLISANSENSDFTTHSFRNKNCYLLISSGINEDCYYGLQVVESRDVVDSVFTRGSELCYECIDCEKMYKGRWCQKSTNCADSSFLYDCHGCTNCFMSVNVRNKSYCFKNEQLSKEAYETKMKEVHLDDIREVSELKKEFADIVQKKGVHKYATLINCERSSGNYLLNCVDARERFDARNLEQCKYIVVSPGPTKDCYDINYCALGSELFCDVLSNVEPAMNEQFCQYSWASSNIQYCSYAMNSDNCFGSQGLRKAKHCILNTQYSEDEYHKLRMQIIEGMNNRGEYGQFFPPSLSAFGYNETIANDEWPLTKEEALKQGFHWSDEVVGRYDPPSRDWSAIPDSISDIDDSICKEVLACSECKKNFKILKSELAFYKKMSVPLPRYCFDCRHMARMHMRNPRKLWHRQCMCDRSGHEHAAMCPAEFETTYAPGRPENVFCERCYQNEVV